jgi:hypothetical protein
VNIRETPIPERMAQRPQYKGIPIPALTMIDDKGIPIFKAIDGDIVWKLKNEHKCGLCGQPLDYWIAFMVTEEEARNQFILESPNHEECLRYAFQVCPWLYYSKAKYGNPEEMKIDGFKFESVHPDREITNERPEKLGVYVCRTWKDEIRGRYRGCKVDKPKRLEWIEGH